MTSSPTPSTPRAPRRGRRLTAAAAAALAVTATLAAGQSQADAAPAPGPDTAPAAAASAACTADGFCEDFEAQTGTELSGRWTASAPNCTGTGAASVDSSVAHTGSKSLRIDGTAGYCNHIFAGTDLTEVAGGSPLHVRFYVRHTTPLPAAHVTFLAMHDPDDGGKDLRMGGQNGALQWNRESDDATLPEQSPTGVGLSRPLPLDEWTCVEYGIEGGILETRVGGEVVQGLVVDGTPTHDIDRQWLNKAGWSPAPTDLRLGWESYGDGADTLWYDDVAVGTSPIGC